MPSFLLAVPLMNIVSISGSPSLRSRSAWLLELAHAQLESTSHERHSSVVRELPASALAVGREVIALVKSTEVSIAAL